MHACGAAAQAGASSASSSSSSAAPGPGGAVSEPDALRSLRRKLFPCPLVVVAGAAAGSLTAQLSAEPAAVAGMRGDGSRMLQRAPPYDETLEAKWWGVRAVSRDAAGRLVPEAAEYAPVASAALAVLADLHARGVTEGALGRACGVAFEVQSAVERGEGLAAHGPALQVREGAATASDRKYHVRCACTCANLLTAVDVVKNHGGELWCFGGALHVCFVPLCTQALSEHLTATARDLPAASTPAPPSSKPAAASSQASNSAPEALDYLRMAWAVAELAARCPSGPDTAATARAGPPGTKREAASAAATQSAPSMAAVPSGVAAARSALSQAAEEQMRGALHAAVREEMQAHAAVVEAILDLRDAHSGLCSDTAARKVGAKPRQPF